MKTLSLFLSLLICLLVVGCGGVDNDVHPEDSYRTITVDGCEYIFISRRPFAGNMALAHKGNCPNH